MTLPVLSTPRLALRPATAADVDALHALWTMPEVRCFLFDGRTIDRAEAAAMVAEFASHNGRGLGLWTMARHDEDDLVGEIGLAPTTEMVALDPSLEGEIEFEIAIHPAHWGLGLAADALEAVLRHGFGTLGLPRIVGVADVPNVASRKLQERAGFVRQRTVKGPVYDSDVLIIERP